MCECVHHLDTHRPLLDESFSNLSRLYFVQESSFSYHFFKNLLSGNVPPLILSFKLCDPTFSRPPLHISHFHTPYVFPSNALYKSWRYREIKHCTYMQLNGSVKQLIFIPSSPNVDTMHVKCMLNANRCDRNVWLCGYCGMSN